jgi:REP element-mobilizing transposase RayT
MRSMDEDGGINNYSSWQYISKEVNVSFWHLNYHIVWATKNRAPVITKEIENVLYGFVIKKASEFGAFVYAINGIEDHIHIIVSIPPSVSISQFVKGVKGASSRKINSIFEGEFSWQRGYGVISLGEKQKSTAIKYVNNQKSHHAEDSTNYWLEHITSENKGPLEKGLNSRTIKEPSGEYKLDQDMPF